MRRTAHFYDIPSKNPESQSNHEENIGQNQLKRQSTKYIFLKTQGHENKDTLRNCHVPEDTKVT